LSDHKFPRWDKVEYRKNPSYLQSLYIGVVTVFFWAPSTLWSALAPEFATLGKVLFGILFLVFRITWALLVWLFDKMIVLLAAFRGRLSHAA